MCPLPPGRAPGVAQGLVRGAAAGPEAALVAGAAASRGVDHVHGPNRVHVREVGTRIVANHATATQRTVGTRAVRVAGAAVVHRQPNGIETELFHDPGVLRQRMASVQRVGPSLVHPEGKRPALAHDHPPDHDLGLVLAPVAEAEVAQPLGPHQDRDLVRDRLTRMIAPQKTAAKKINLIRAL